MTLGHSIKRQVERLLEEGIKLEYAWHHIQAQFPHKICGWNYMRRIEREWKRANGEISHGS